jgi:energy-coupling factor transporter ATP-binding protein EcfA2
MRTLKVNLNQAASVIRAVGTTNTVILRGQPGVGKSAILTMLAKELPDYIPCYIDVANLDLGDLGMPVIDRETMVTNYAPNARFGLSRTNKRPLLIMLDELGKASRPVLNMLLPLVNEHRIADVALPTGSIVLATTNLDTDGVGDNIPAHAYNRMTELVIANPTADEWLHWASDNDIAPEIMAFVKQNPEVMTCYTDLPAKDKNPYIFNPLTGNTRTFCSPRSLERASYITKQRGALGDAFLPALAGTIGESAAQLMVALVNLADTLPLYENIVKDPHKTKVPKGDAVGAMFILAFMLANRVSEDDLDAVMVYAERIPSFEAYSLFVSSLAGNRSKVGMACKNRKFTAAAAKLGKYF